MNVILDIDETLLQLVNKDTWNALPEAQQKLYELGGEFKDSVIVLRPKFRSFLEFLRDTCKTVSLWTWSSKEYSHFVKKMAESKVDGLTISNAWCNEEAAASMLQHGHSKDLNYIWYVKKMFQPCDTILVDDMAENAHNKSNIHNGILVPHFRPLTGMAKDDTFRKVARIIQAAIDNPDFCRDGDLPKPFTRARRITRRQKSKSQR